MVTFHTGGASARFTRGLWKGKLVSLFTREHRGNLPSRVSHQLGQGLSYRTCRASSPRDAAPAGSIPRQTGGRSRFQRSRHLRVRVDASKNAADAGLGTGRLVAAQILRHVRFVHGDETRCVVR